MARRVHSHKRSQRHGDAQATTTAVTAPRDEAATADAATATAATTTTNNDSLFTLLPATHASNNNNNNATAVSSTASTPPTTSPVLRARRFPSAQRHVMSPVAMTNAPLTVAYDGGVAGDGRNSRGSGGSSSGGGVVVCDAVTAAAAAQAAASPSLSSSSYVTNTPTTTTTSSPVYHSPVTAHAVMTRARLGSGSGSSGGSPLTHDAPTSWQQLLARNNRLNARTSTTSLTPSEHGGGGGGNALPRPRSRGGCSTTSTSEARGMTVIYPHHLGGLAGSMTAGNRHHHHYNNNNNSHAAGVSDVVKSHAMADVYARYAHAAALHMHSGTHAHVTAADDHHNAASANDKDKDKGASGVTANLDLAEVHVEGYYAQNMGVLIPNDLPRSTLLYVLTASDGRDLMFKLAQYTLQLTICFLKTPALFSPDALAVTEPWAERLYRNYNTIRHGRSLFKVGRGLLNFFTLQTVCERLWRRYAWPRLPRVLRGRTMTPSSSFAQALWLLWWRVVVLRVVRACARAGVPCAFVQRPLLRHLRRLVLHDTDVRIDDDLVDDDDVEDGNELPQQDARATTTTTAANASLHQQQQQRLLPYGHKAKQTRDEADVAALLSDDMYVHAPAVESVAATRTRRAPAMPYLPRNASSSSSTAAADKLARILATTTSSNSASAANTTAAAMTTRDGVCDVTTTTGTVDAHARALQQKAAAASVLHGLPMTATTATTTATTATTTATMAATTTAPPTTATAATAQDELPHAQRDGDDATTVQSWLSTTATPTHAHTTRDMAPLYAAHTSSLSSPFALPTTTAQMHTDTAPPSLQLLARRSDVAVAATTNTNAADAPLSSYDDATSARVDDSRASALLHTAVSSRMTPHTTTTTSTTTANAGTASNHSATTNTTTANRTTASDSLTSHSHLDLYVDGRATYADSESLPPPPHVTHTLPLLTPATALATDDVDEDATATKMASAGGATPALLRAGRDVAEAEAAAAAAAAAKQSRTPRVGDDTDATLPATMAAVSPLLQATTTAQPPQQPPLLTSEAARRASQTATHVPPAATLYSLLDAQERTLASAATTTATTDASNNDAQQQQATATATTTAALPPPAAPPGSAYDDSDVSIISRVSSVDAFDSLDRNAHAAVAEGEEARRRRRHRRTDNNNNNGSGSDDDDDEQQQQPHACPGCQHGHLVPAAAAEPARWRHGPLSFRPLLMVLLGVRNAAAGVRRCLRDVTLISSERFVRFGYVEQHRARLTRRLNYLWLLVATIDLLLNTVRLLQPGWMRYAMARQDLYSRCGCRASEDADDAIVRRGTYFARRKTDLFFPPLSLDYGAPLPSTIAYMEAANPRHMLPACSRCGYLYKHDSDDDEEDGGGVCEGDSGEDEHVDDDTRARGEAAAGGRGDTRTAATLRRAQQRSRRRVQQQQQQQQQPYEHNDDDDSSQHDTASDDMLLSQQQQQGQQHKQKHKAALVKDGLDTVGVMFIPWLLRKLYNYLWLLSTHANFKATVLMELRCAAELFLAYKYCFGGYETNRADAPLTRILNPYCALAGVVTAAVGLLRVVESAPK